MDQDNEIRVIGEEAPNTITYSRALVIPLSRLCKNKCPYCSFPKKDNLTVPYSTIKQIKLSRNQGIREVLYIAGERPDKFTHIRSALNLWGFSSYVDYIYTVAELGFLEGLIPVLDVGFLTPLEMKKVSEVTSVIKIMLDDITTQNNVTPSGKRLEIRYKSLEWASKLQIPIATGILVGLGESLSKRENAFKEIKRLHEEYGMIHEVLLQNFIPDPKISYKNKSATSKEVMLETTEKALSILPKTIKVIVPIEQNPDIEDFVKLGVRDLGRICEENSKIFYQTKKVDIENLRNRMAAMGFVLQQRFPIGFDFVKNGGYSKKLGQIFDAYRYKIKKEEQEKIKEI
ncbi:MAG: 7,8-didemethyl-8-hydroxy-5-deazariboflavin synthase subunit CofG [Candidatus Margulisiibacteriota bacterium]|jgi:7,8-didemethyl-8-hydroxy-5-deazariboflavin synthase CofG subunit